MCVFGWDGEGIRMMWGCWRGGGACVLGWGGGGGRGKGISMLEGGGGGGGGRCVCSCMSGAYFGEVC